MGDYSVLESTYPELVNHIHGLSGDEVATKQNIYPAYLRNN